LLVIFFVICHTLLPQKKIVGISLQNVRRNPNETFNEIPMKHFLWQNMLPHMANEIPTKLRRNLNDTFLSPHWLYPIYCKRRIIMLEPHTNQWTIRWNHNNSKQKVQLLRVSHFFQHAFDEPMQQKWLSQLTSHKQRTAWTGSCASPGFSNLICPCTSTALFSAETRSTWNWCFITSTGMSVHRLWIP